MSPAGVACLLAAISDEALASTRQVIFTATPHPVLRDEVLAAIDAEQRAREDIYDAIRKAGGQS